MSPSNIQLALENLFLLISHDIHDSIPPSIPYSNDR